MFHKSFTFSESIVRLNLLFYFVICAKQRAHAKNYFINILLSLLKLFSVKRFVQDMNSFRNNNLKTCIKQLQTFIKFSYKNTFKMCIKQLETLIKLNYKIIIMKYMYLKKLYFVKCNYFTLKLNFKKLLFLTFFNSHFTIF